MPADVIRRPAVAGYLYPADRRALEALIDRSVAPPRVAEQATALVLPHSSYERIAGVVGSTLGAVVVPKRCVIISPTHTGSWMPWSLMTSGAYRTPLGDMPVDAPFAEALQQRCPFLETDAWAQRGEHGIEVLVPFLQRLAPPGATVVPIVTGSDDAESLRHVGAALAQVARMVEEPVLIIASTELSAYRPDAETRAIDRRIVERICRLDAAGVADAAADAQARMCGVNAVRAVLGAALALGARRGDVAAYETSAGCGGDPDSSTGYAGIMLR